jgi:hypothetical protein
MGRVFLTVIIPLLLPTAFYVLWRAMVGKQINIPSVWLWLTVAGLVFACLTLVLLTVNFGAPVNGEYVPPHISGDKVVPGHIEAAPQN